MADSPMSYAIVVGIFAFLVAVLFTARYQRPRHMKYRVAVSRTLKLPDLQSSVG